MAVKSILRASGTGTMVNRSTSNDIRVDSADELLKYKDGAGTVRSAVTADQTQTLTNKTLTAPTLTAPVLTGVVASSTVRTGADTSVPWDITAGLSDISNATSGTVQNTEYTLNTVTIKANAFNANTRALQVVAWGTLAANANAKNLKIYFGATAVASITGSTANAKDFMITLDVVRLASNSQSAVGTVQIDTGAAVTMACTATLTETDTADIVIAVKSANTAAAASSGTGKGMVATFIN